MNFKFNRHHITTILSLIGCILFLVLALVFNKNDQKEDVINSYNSAKCYELFLLMLFYIFRQDSIVLRHLTADDIMTFIIRAADDTTL